MTAMNDPTKWVGGCRVFGHSKSGKAILEMEQRDGFLWCRDEDGWQPVVMVRDAIEAVLNEATDLADLGGDVPLWKLKEALQ